MPGLTNEASNLHQQSQSLLDQNGQQNNQNQNPEVYIIPEYSLSRSHPGHLLVLPFVPHPSASSSSNSNVSNFQAPAPPPHYFCTARTTTPSYHDPPPDYETIGHINHGATFETTGLTPSCSCSTQLTSVADDYGARSLHGIYDNGSGLSGLDRNEALTASYLYPELLNVTSTRTRTSFSSNHQQRRLLRPQSSISSTSSTTISTIQQQRSSSIFSNQRQYLTVKKWVIVVLVLMLLMTISLLVGITLQHFQLLRKFLHTQKKTSEQEMMMQSTTTERFSSADIMENFIPK